MVKLFDTKHVEVKLTFTDRCNARCKTCLQHTLQAKPAQYLDWQTYKRIIEEVVKLEETEVVTFSSTGEPYLHPEYVSMVEWALPILRKKGIQTACITNGSLVTRVPSGIDHFFISFNAGTKLSYEKITGLSFEQTIMNIRRLYLNGEFRKAHDVQIHMLVFKENADEVAEVKKIFNFLKGVTLRLSYKFDNQHGVIADQGIQVTGKNRIPCDYVTSKIIFDCTGNVLLCSHDFRGDISFGNVNRADLQTILKNPVRLRYLEEHRRSEFTNICHSCQYNIKTDDLFVWNDLHQKSRLRDCFDFLCSSIRMIRQSVCAGIMSRKNKG